MSSELSETSNKHKPNGLFSTRTRAGTVEEYFVVNSVDKHSNLDQSSVRATNLP